MFDYSGYREVERDNEGYGNCDRFSELHLRLKLTLFKHPLMSDSRLVKISKYLSKYLRHTPDAIGIKLAPSGWVVVDELLTACAKNKFPITRHNNS
ncbi:RNA 2'-phosphotransferase [Nostoc sphaeroides]